MKEQLIAKIASRQSAITNLEGINERQQKSLEVLIGQITERELKAGKLEGAVEKEKELAQIESVLKVMRRMRGDLERQVEYQVEHNERVIARHRSDIAGFTRELDAIVATEARETARTITQTIAAINGRRVSAKGKKRGDNRKAA